MNILDLHGDKISPEPMSGCWLWIGAHNPKGYGRVNFKGDNRYAHRVSYLLSCDEIPEGILVLHKCDTPACVNPDHLFLGTNDDNMIDRNKKGRQAKLPGERNGFSVLTEAQVLEIRALREGSSYRNSGELSQKNLAKKYGVGQTAISKVLNRETWSHI